MIRIPSSTYRLQLNKDFTFSSAAGIMDYLHKLGISDIYASPVWKARKGSTHGYDVVEPAEINPELGSEDDFSTFRETIKKYSFGWLQDIVPNHMAYSSENQMLIDLLENGQNSRYFNFFDIDWKHPHASIGERILAPFLGKRYPECLENGEIKLKYDQAGFSVNYYETRLPLRMESYSVILSFGLNNLVSVLGREDPDIIKYLGVVYFLYALPTAEQIDERYYQIRFVKGILWELYSNNEMIRSSIDKTLEALNGVPGNPGSYDHLDNILRNQHYRLCFWKVAVEEINYRRFFNINELISLRMENEEVYRRTHRLINELVKSGDVTGLRIDHIDGLYNPSAYLKRLREDSRDTYILVEKILGYDENLPDNWPVEGTTGYEFINYLNGLFISKKNERAITSAYQRFTKYQLNNEETAYQHKRMIIRERMAGEVERLAYLIEAISSKDRYGVDITMLALKRALEEILTYFPVYRTYINRNDYSSQDKKYINYVISKVTRLQPKLSNEVNYIGNILRLEFSEHISETQKELALDFVMKFQQLTGPLMAKGFEDTALYVYNRFLSLNEVGGEPGVFGFSPEEYHKFIRKRFSEWPYSMNASSTHDTKRGEDVRARINVLSELPQEWDEKVRYWNKINRKHKIIIDKVNMPDRNDEYFLYQNIVGAFPFDISELTSFRNRMKDYIVKAVREAKVHTAWIKPDEEYEKTFTGFVEAILTPGSEFLEDLVPFQNKISFYGIYNSLAQTIIKLTSPGVPDIYQGSEVWNLSLVDPDNRRPVNYPLLMELLNSVTSSPLKEESLREMLEKPASGKIKLYFTHKLLQHRKENKEFYTRAEYEPLVPEGKSDRNIIAFRRMYNGQELITLSGRYFTSVIPWGNKYDSCVWEDTSVKLPGGAKYRELLTGKEFGDEITELKNILKQFPFAVLSTF